MNDISKKRIDRLVPEAIEMIKKLKIANNENKINNSYNGYIASFGADMINSSAMAAAIYFEFTPGGGKDKASSADRTLIPKAVLQLMQKERTENDILKKCDKLSEYLASFKGAIPAQVIQDIMASSIALKLGMRTFTKVEN